MAKKGQNVLIHAGFGGVGSFAIQLAKHFGATVATTTSSANLELVKKLGADIAIDYRKDDFANALRDCDVVLHSIGGDVLEKSLGVLGPGGQLISISGPPGIQRVRDPEVVQRWTDALADFLAAFGVRVREQQDELLAAITGCEIGRTPSLAGNDQPGSLRRPLPMLKWTWCTLLGVPQKAPERHCELAATVRFIRRER